MRYIVFLFPLLTWAILPQAEMEKITKQYYNNNASSISSHTYDHKNYYIIHYVEEKLFSDDSLEEEKVYLKAGIKQTLFNAMKEKHPKMISLKVSGLLHGSFWENQGFYHHIAQVRTELINPIFVTKSTSSVPKSDIVNNHSSLGHEEVSIFTIKRSETHREIQKKIDHLESKSKKYPYNLKLLQELSRLYKQIGDTEGYSLINERIMNAKMNI